MSSYIGGLLCELITYLCPDSDAGLANLSNKMSRESVHSWLNQYVMWSNWSIM